MYFIHVWAFSVLVKRNTVTHRNTHSGSSTGPNVGRITTITKISPAAMSHILGGHNCVDRRAHSGIRTTVRHVGCAPGSVTHTVLGNHLGLVNVVIPFIDDPFRTRIIRTIRHALTRGNFGVLLYGDTGQPSLRHSCVSVLHHGVISNIVIGSLGVNTRTCTRVNLDLINVSYSLNRNSIRVTDSDCNVNRLTAHHLVSSNYEHVLYLHDGDHVHVPTGGHASTCLSIIRRTNLSTLIHRIRFIGPSSRGNAIITGVLSRGPSVSNVFTKSSAVTTVYLGIVGRHNLDTPSSVGIINTSNTHHAVAFVPSLAAMHRSVSHVKRLTTRSVVTLVGNSGPRSGVGLPIRLVRNGAT